MKSMIHTRRFTSKLILAGLVIATMAGMASLPAAAFAAPAAESKKVNVNTADTSQLALLPRVGPSVAQKIVAFRKENGPFKSPEDLMLVQGIGEKTWQLLKPYVAISGETTLREKVKSSKTGSTAPKEKAPKESSR